MSVNHSDIYSHKNTLQYNIERFENQDIDLKGIWYPMFNLASLYFSVGDSHRLTTHNEIAEYHSPITRYKSEEIETISGEKFLISTVSDDITYVSDLLGVLKIEKTESKKHAKKYNRPAIAKLGRFSFNMSHNPTNYREGLTLTRPASRNQNQLQDWAPKDHKKDKYSLVLTDNQIHFPNSDPNEELSLAEYTIEMANSFIELPDDITPHFG